jgi:hypothetical protein
MMNRSGRSITLLALFLLLTGSLGGAQVTGDPEDPECGDLLPSIHLLSPYSSTVCYPDGTDALGAKRLLKQHLEAGAVRFTCDPANFESDKACKDSAKLQSMGVNAVGGGDCTIPDSGGVIGTEWTATLQGGYIERRCTVCATPE